MSFMNICMAYLFNYTMPLCKAICYDYICSVCHVMLLLCIFIECIWCPDVLNYFGISFVCSCMIICTLGVVHCISPGFACWGDFILSKFQNQFWTFSAQTRQISKPASFFNMGGEGGGGVVSVGRRGSTGIGLVVFILLVVFSFIHN